MFGGDPGISRMFCNAMGTEISWLLPLALIGLVAGLWFTRRAPRTDRTRAALLLWGGWTLLTALIFSFMKGIIHPYYTVALAPAVAALAGITVTRLWQGRAHRPARIVLGLALAATGVWHFVLLARTPEWFPWLRWVVLVGAILVAAVLIVGAHQLGRLTAAIAMAGVLFGLAGPAAYTLETVLGPSNGGPNPTSGPKRGGSGPPDFGGGVDKDELQRLLADSDERWAAAAIGSTQSASLQLSSGRPVISIGGFFGSDPAPDLVQFQQYVDNGEIGYFVVDNRGPGGAPSGGGDDDEGSKIKQWVQNNFPSDTIDGTTVYDLTS